MTLGKLSEGRNNNLNLVRVMAALSVLISHSFTLATGDPLLEPLRLWTGTSLGTLAVDVFFLVSGFLVSASAANRSLLQYLGARMLRIYPGLLAMLVVTVLGIGGALSVLELWEFVSHPMTWQYLQHNATLVAGVAYVLPGLFTHNPYPLAVNGPLWTLVVEVRMYLLLGGIYALAALAGAGRERILKLVSAVMVVVTLAFLVYVHLYTTRSTDWLRLYYMFAAGAAMYAWRHSIPLRSRMAFVFAVLLLVVYFATPRNFIIACALLLPLLLMWAAYVPAGWIRAYNSAGDYSYGIYIYAFPIQQAIVSLSDNVTPLQLIALATAATLPCAVLSWHLVEKPALRWKDTGVRIFRARYMSP